MISFASFRESIDPVGVVCASLRSGPSMQQCPLRTMDTNYLIYQQVPNIAMSCGGPSLRSGLDSPAPVPWNRSTIWLRDLCVRGLHNRLAVVYRYPHNNKLAMCRWLDG